MILFIVSLIAGFLTVLAPCVLPLLPVIVGGSVTGDTVNKKKAFVITISLGVSVIVFTLFLKASTLFITIPSSVWQWISGGIIFILGCITLFPAYWEKISAVAKLNRESNKLIGIGYQKKSLIGDIIIGAALGPVFSSCSPTYFFILATILPAQPAAGFIYLLAYSVGLCAALLIISFAGQKIIEKLGVASDPHGWIKRLLGLIFIILGVAIITGAEKRLEARLLDSGFFDITKVEQLLLKHVDSTTGLNITPDSRAANLKKSQFYPKAPEIVKPSGFVNTEGKPITISQFKGKKIVLLDVWTYSCINCQRTLPYVKAWYDKYKDQGLEIIGLHTPEFSFEKVQANVEKAVKDAGITYPVVLDNEYATWNAYGNQYWPRKYLIDLDGYVVYDHIGEGNYDDTERAIVKALGERAEILNAASSTASTTEVSMPTTGRMPQGVIAFEGDKVKSPEVYFGAERNEYLGVGRSFSVGIQSLMVPEYIDMKLNTLYLGGTWDFQKEYAETVDPVSSIFFTYSAKNVYMVASAPHPIDVDIWIDGIKVRTMTIKDEKLYTLVEGKTYGQHRMEIKIVNMQSTERLLKAFTFTFG